MRPGVSPFSSDVGGGGGYKYPAAGAAPSGFPKGLETSYLANLLQRHPPQPLPAVSEGLAAYQTRDLLQFRADLLTRLKPDSVAGGEPLLAVAQKTMEWQLRTRENATHLARCGTAPAASGRSAATTGISPSVRGGDYAKLVEQVLRGEVLKSRACNSAWAAHRVTELATSEAKIQSRRRPDVIYFERPSTEASTLASQLASFPVRQKAPVQQQQHSHGEDRDHHQQQQQQHHHAATSPSPHDNLVDANGVMAAPWRPHQNKRLGIPVVLKHPAAAPAPAASAAPAKSPLRLPRGDTLLTHWRGRGSSSSSSSTSGGGGGGGGGEDGAVARPFTAQAAAVLAAAPSLLQHFSSRSATEASAMLATAARFNVTVATSSSAGDGEAASTAQGADAEFISPLLRPSLPAPEVINRALRPLTAPAAAGGGTGSKPPPPVPNEEPPLEEGAPIPIPHPSLFVGGLYGQHPLDYAAQQLDLKDRIIKEQQKLAKALAAAAKGGGDKKK
jgi:hypothetical protein